MTETIKLIRGVVTTVIIDVVDSNGKLHDTLVGDAKMTFVADTVEPPMVVETTATLNNGTGLFPVNVAADIPEGRYVADVATSGGNTERFIVEVVDPIAELP